MNQFKALLVRYQTLWFRKKLKESIGQQNKRETQRLLTKYFSNFDPTEALPLNALDMALDTKNAQIVAIVAPFYKNYLNQLECNYPHKSNTPLLPLEKALEFNSVDILKTLLELGADPQSTSLAFKPQSILFLYMAGAFQSVEWYKKAVKDSIYYPPTFSEELQKEIQAARQERLKTLIDYSHNTEAVHSIFQTSALLHTMLTDHKELTQILQTLGFKLTEIDHSRALDYFTHIWTDILEDNSAEDIEFTGLFDYIAQIENIEVLNNFKKRFEQHFCFKILSLENKQLLEEAYGKASVVSQKNELVAQIAAPNNSRETPRFKI